MGLKGRMAQCLLAISLLFATFSFSHNQDQNSVNYWKQTEQCVFSSSKIHRQTISLKKASSVLVHQDRRVAIAPYRIRFFDKLILIKLQALSRQGIPTTQAFLQSLSKTIPASSDEDEMTA